MPVLNIPFDAGHLDRLMDEAGLDLLVVSTKHNVQYLLGGFRSLFFQHMDANGLSRYLPLVVYPKGEAEKAAYIGHSLEKYQREVQDFWTPAVYMSSSGTLDAMKTAIEHIRKTAIPAKRIGIEFPFMPLDAANALADAFSSSTIKDTVFILERLRARKTPEELTLLRHASEKVIDAMTAVMSGNGPGAAKRDLVESLRREQTNRGLIFDYCLITMGTSLNRAPSEQKWEKGDILSLDSGANYHGYIGDVCRMAILGEPDAELEELLGEIEIIQRAAMAPIKPGAMGGEIYEAAEALVAKSKHHNSMEFLAHGMGLVTHEAPRLTDKGPVFYNAYDACRPLEEGMVISVETTLKHPRRGFIKLEDTVAVTGSGHEIYGEGGRGWNRAASA